MIARVLLSLALWTPQEESAPAPEAAPALELSLSQFVRAVLERNLTLRMAEVDRDATVQGIHQALGAFDPELFADVRGGVAETPTSSLFTASATETFNGGLGLRGLGRSGLSWDLSYSMDFARQVPTNPFFSFNPTLTSGVSLALRQPLLRGAGSLATEAGLEQAELAVQRSDHQLLIQVHDTAFLAAQAYWNFVFELRSRNTARTALEVAQELVANTERMKDAGIRTRLDVLQAQSEAARRQEALINAENRVAQAEDVLKQLLSPGEDLAEWNTDLVPTTEPGVEETDLPSQEQAITVALAERDDLRALEVDLRAADLDLAVNENQSLSALDMVASYGLRGLGGRFRGTDPVTGQPVVEDDSNWDMYRESIRPIRESRFENWNIGLEFSHPLGNRSARANVRQARLRKERALLALSQLRMDIVQETRGALRDVENARARSEAARTARILAEEQYEAEKVRLENKFATTFEVREAQRDLFEAIDIETRAILDYEIQRARLSQVQGILAYQYGVTPVDADRDVGAIRNAP